MLYCLTIPTPNQHPGFKDMLFEGPDDAMFCREYADIDAEPERGASYDSVKRTVYAAWKERFWKWLQARKDIEPITPLYL